MKPATDRALAELEVLLHANVDQVDVVLLPRPERFGQEPLRSVVHRRLERSGIGLPLLHPEGRREAETPRRLVLTR